MALTSYRCRMVGSRDLLKTLPSASVTSETHVEEVINVIKGRNNGSMLYKNAAAEEKSCSYNFLTLFFLHHHNWSPWLLISFLILSVRKKVGVTEGWKRDQSINFSTHQLFCSNRPFMYLDFQNFSRNIYSSPHRLVIWADLVVIFPDCVWDLIWSCCGNLSF